MAESASSTFLAAALTARGWIIDPILDIKVNLLTGGAGPRFADYTRPAFEHLRVCTRKTPHAAAADFEHSQALPGQAAPVRGEPTRLIRDEESAASLQRPGAVREQEGS